MAIESDADRLALLDDFGQDGIYAGTETLRGILDEDYVEMDGMTGYGPVYTCRQSDVVSKGVEKGGTLALAEGTFTVAVVPPTGDGTGMCKLILEGV